MLEAKKRTALLVSAVYFVLYLLSSAASRHAYRLTDWQGNEARASRFIWRVEWLLFAGLLPSLWFKWYPLVIAGFVAIEVLDNFWRPMFVSRINAHSEPTMGATILSIESQARSFATMLIAPGLGWTVDTTGSFWSVAVIGMLVASCLLLSRKPLEWAY